MSAPGWSTPTIAAGIGVIAGGMASAFTAAPQPRHFCGVYTPVRVNLVEAPWLPTERLSGVQGWPEMTRLIVPYEPEEEAPEHEAVPLIKAKEAAESFLKPAPKERIAERLQKAPRHHRRRHRRHW